MSFGVQLEVTTKCNSKCAFCPREGIIKSGKRPIADIKIKTFEKILDRLVESGYQFDWISISGLGEPLMYDFIFTAIREVRKRFPYTFFKMNTNALLVKNNNVKALIDCGLDRLVCSLNAADKQTFEDYKHIDYDKVEKNIIKFLHDKGSRKPDTYIRVNAFDSNILLMQEARNHWKPYLNCNDRFSPGRFSNWAGKIDRHKFVSHDLTTERTICKFLDNERVVAINLDGAVFPCCVAIAENGDSQLYLGNILNTPLRELYESARMEYLQLDHIRGSYPRPCKECDSWGKQVENLDKFLKAPKIRKLRQLIRR